MGRSRLWVRRLAIVDAKTIHEHQRLRKAAAAQGQVRLRAARAALFEENGRVVPQQIERSFRRECPAFDRQNEHGSGRFRQRSGDRGTQDHHGLGGMRKCR